MSDQELNDKQNQIPNNLEMSFEESKSDQTLLTDEMPTFKFNNLMDSPVSSIGFNSSSDDSSDEEREKTVCLKSVSNEVPSNCSVVSGASDSEHYISLEEINAQISSPWEKPIKHKNSLETIFEGNFDDFISASIFNREFLLKVNF